MKPSNEEIDWVVSRLHNPSALTLALYEMLKSLNEESNDGQERDRETEQESS